MGKIWTTPLPVLSALALASAVLIQQSTASEITEASPEICSLHLLIAHYLTKKAWSQTSVTAKWGITSVNLAVHPSSLVHLLQE